jgi:ribosomal protein S18 acetylase RimI-like enzyme
MVRCRVAVREDIPAMFTIRTSVHENTMTWERLRELGIDADLVEAAITTHGRGWVTEDEGRVVGFCIADRRDGSIFALYILPEMEGRGHGKALLAAGTSYLVDAGYNRPWLSVGCDTRAQRFYIRNGWIETGTVENGDVRMEKRVV